MTFNDLTTTPNIDNKSAQLQSPRLGSRTPSRNITYKHHQALSLKKAVHLYSDSLSFFFFLLPINNKSTHSQSPNLGSRTPSRNITYRHLSLKRAAHLYSSGSPLFTYPRKSRVSPLATSHEKPRLPHSPTYHSQPRVSRTTYNLPPMYVT
ncbi:uncharacterized protein EI90DRAFT_443913 [Cantharellus anzutake]|uniref:uncharacterized protein n=1 Tax=Cantharellus anzutake TaxID=1750568 RepID=UPI0019072F21|nr:uncharacterized protein EI90DRAFT_443913 [Cantharellus anzutake]KAF8334627.1 hypothetical protein EI90DRAFT_443913 [Cantharellus anzutake]